jgi:DNA polymerase-3 subunit delta'
MNSELLGHSGLLKSLKGFTKEDKLAHGYIFFGPTGVGKFSFARAFANYLETKNFAVSIESDRPLIDCFVLSKGTIDAESSSIGVDAVRSLQKFLYDKPIASSRRTAILADADLLTTEAQNALLKITEEPPAHTLIILIIPNPEELLPTLRSRFHELYFGTIPETDITDWLVSEHSISAKEAKHAAHMSHGGPGLALRIASDEGFKKELGDAEAFLSGSSASRKALIKELNEDESFSLPHFLDMLLMASSDSIEKNMQAVRFMLDLRAKSHDFGLNAKLQLTALSELLK